VSKRSVATVVVAAVAAIVFTGGVALVSGSVIRSVHQIRPSVRSVLTGPRGYRGETGAPCPLRGQ
jgi:hypothetical protein